MAKDYQDLQHLESEDNGHQFSKGPPSHQPILQRLCPLNRLLLLSLGLSFLLVVIISVLGSKNTQLQGDLQTLKATFTNFSEKMVSEIQALDTQGRSMSEKVRSLEAELQKHQKDREEDLSNFLFHEQRISADFRTLHCQVLMLQSNGTRDSTCCPLGWLEFEENCYWFSRTGKSWPEAEKYCQMENSHLVVMNTWNEQNFVSHHTSPAFAWIGLTDLEGTWRWVDGTSYDSNIKHVYVDNSGVATAAGVLGFLQLAAGPAALGLKPRLTGTWAPLGLAACCRLPDCCTGPSCRAAGLSSAGGRRKLNCQYQK